MSRPLFVAVPLLLALLAQPASAMGPSSGEGRVNDAIRIQGDVVSTFGAGAVAVDPRTNADGLDFVLRATELKVDYYADRYWTFEDVPASVQSPDVRDEPVHEEATLTDVSVTLPKPDLDDDPTLLVFTDEATWTAPGASGATFRVSTADVACELALERKKTLVSPPQHAETRRTFWGDDAFRFELPTPSFFSGASDQSGQTHVEASGLVNIYVWGFDVKLASDQGDREYRTGQQLIHGVPGEPAAMTDQASHIEYSYVMLTATKEAVLDALVSTRSTTWYAPEPDVTIVGAIAAEWQGATMDAGGRRYAADGTASLQGSFALRPRHTVDGSQVEWDGDLAATSFRTTATGGVALPSSTLATALQIALLLTFPIAALAVVRLRRQRFQTVASLPTVAAPVGERPVVVVPAVPNPAPRPAAAPPTSGRVPVVGTTKDNVLRLIERKPGVHLASAAAELRIPRSIAFHHVHDLGRRGLVFSVPVQGRYALFRVGHWTPEDANAQAALTSPRTREVAMLLLEKPGVTIAALVDRTHMPARSVARELQRLRARGLALRDMLARPAKYHPSDRLRRLAERGEETPEVPAPVDVPAAPLAIASTNGTNGSNGHAPPVEVAPPAAGVSPV